MYSLFKLLLDADCSAENTVIYDVTKLNNCVHFGHFNVCLQSDGVAGSERALRSAQLECGAAPCSTTSLGTSTAERRAKLSSIRYNVKKKKRQSLRPPDRRWDHKMSEKQTCYTRQWTTILRFILCAAATSPIFKRFPFMGKRLKANKINRKKLGQRRKYEEKIFPCVLFYALFVCSSSSCYRNVYANFCLLFCVSIKLADLL